MGGNARVNSLRHSNTVQFGKPANAAEDDVGLKRGNTNANGAGAASRVNLR